MTNPFISPCSAVAEAASGLLASVTPALAPGADRQAYHIPRGDAAETLQRFADQSGKQIIYLLDTVRSVTTNAIRGEFTARDALIALLANTRLALVEDTKTGALMVNPVAATSAPVERPAAKVRRISPLTVLGGWLALALTPLGSASAANTGVLTGDVSNVATSKLLEGARVELPALARSTLTDNTGRYVFAGLPAGSHMIVATYLGLDAVRAEVTLAAGQRAVRDFELTAGIYQMAEFKVTGEREGYAAALTEKRNATNVKDVVAMDQFGNLPNLGTGEVVMRLPGVAGSPSDEGIRGRFMIRGMDAALNSVTIDGGLMSTQGLGRNASLGNVNATMFESVELIKGHTPDKGADSLGGTLNLKTRSPLNLREKRRTTYNFVTRLAPPFFEQTPIREKHRAHPLATLAHQEVFDVLGGSRNLGVALNLFYSENAVGGASTAFDYRNSLNNDDAYIWDFTTWDNANNRKQMSATLKTEFRLSPVTKLTLGLTGNFNFERHRSIMEVRAFTGNNTFIPNATTSGIEYRYPHARPDQLQRAHAAGRRRGRARAAQSPDRLHGLACDHLGQRQPGHRRRAHDAALRGRLDSRSLAVGYVSPVSAQRRTGFQQSRQLPSRAEWDDEQQ
jgi:hypothetical protein